MYSRTHISFARARALSWSLSLLFSLSPSLTRAFLFYLVLSLSFSLSLSLHTSQNTSPHTSLSKPKQKVFFAMAEPTNPEKHLQENEFYCSYVWDPSIDDEQSTLHSLAEDDFLVFFPPKHISPKKIPFEKE